MSNSQAANMPCYETSLFPFYSINFMAYPPIKVAKSSIDDIDCRSNITQTTHTVRDANN